MELYKNKISILMPCYNEGDRIYENLIKACETFKKLGFLFEILAINDGSSDNTGDEIARAAFSHTEIKLTENIFNQGKGHALKKGFANSSGDIIIFLDGDLEIDPSQVGKLLKAMEDSGVEVVVGSKRHKESTVKYPLVRVILSTGYFFIVKILFNLSIKDTQAGIKAYKREVLAEIFPKILCKKYAFDVEILANAVNKGYKILEVPIQIIFSRNNPFGRIKLSDITNIFKDTAAIWYRIKIKHYYD